jgi:RHS repeat-associated protein
MVLNQYDELGQLKNKKVGGDVATDIGNSIGIQTVDYTYNIRGWLTQINDPSSLGADLFSFKINYNKVGHGATPLYNGNISETEWKTQSDNSLRWYKYGYDNLNRITSGIDNTSDQRYSLQSIAYDKNGNITSLLRKGHVVANPVSGNSTDFGIMDNLTYSYQTNSNKLLKVADAAGTDTYGFKDDAVNTAADTADDYTYDVNGNLTTDSNKAITNISYNHLNLPTQVTFSSGNIQYIYDATGVKLKKIVSTGTTTEYAGNYIYENGNLQFFNTPEGYAEPINVGNYTLGFKHTYQYKDHLGNIRLSYKDLNQNTGAISLSIVEENNYYPFGLKHKGYNGGSNGQRHHKYMFGGKELQDEIVGSSSFEVYDFGARNYDAALGRWMNLDPLAEQMRRHSPYNYAFDNPIYFIDPDGMKPMGPGDPPTFTEKAKSAINKLASGFFSFVQSQTTGEAAYKMELAQTKDIKKKQELKLNRDDNVAKSLKEASDPETIADAFVYSTGALAENTEDISNNTINALDATIAVGGDSKGTLAKLSKRINKIETGSQLVQILIHAGYDQNYDAATVVGIRMAKDFFGEKVSAIIVDESQKAGNITTQAEKDSQNATWNLLYNYVMSLLNSK